MNFYKTIYIGLGSNLGERLDYIKEAIDLIKKLPSRSVKAVSSIYESEPYGKTDQPKFLNCVLKLNTELEPLELLRKLKDIEKKIGRTEAGRWDPRIIDIDILLYDDLFVDLPELKIPHPDMLNRDFVIKPLLELDESIVHPIEKRKIFDLVRDKRLGGKSNFYSKLN